MWLHQNGGSACVRPTLSFSMASPHVQLLRWLHWHASDFDGMRSCVGPLKCVAGASQVGVCGIYYVSQPQRDWQKESLFMLQNERVSTMPVNGVSGIVKRCLSLAVVESVKRWSVPETSHAEAVTETRWSQSECQERTRMTWALWWVLHSAQLEHITSWAIQAAAQGPNCLFISAL